MGTAEWIIALQRLIDGNMRLRNTDSIVRAVPSDLVTLIASGQIELEPPFHQIKPGSYARRLLFRNSVSGYSVVIMTWARGQCTPIHDHAGIWCVEGVVRGIIYVIRHKLEAAALRGQCFQKCFLSGN